MRIMAGTNESEPMFSEGPSEPMRALSIGEVVKVEGMFEKLKVLAEYIKQNGVTEESINLFLDQIDCGSLKEINCDKCPIGQKVCLKLSGFDNDVDRKAIDLRRW